MNVTQKQVFSILFWCAVATLLSIMLIYPFGYDQYVFMVGGEKLVKEGAIPFRDVMDTKPMLIMYLYGWASALFGHAMYSIRIVDVIYHLVALYVYFRLLRGYLQSESIAYLTVSIYALLYVSTGLASTAQAESFALLPTLGIIYTTEKIEDATKSSDLIPLVLLTSICAFALFALKITLIIIPFALCIWMVIDKPDTRKFQSIHLLGMAAGLLALIGSLVAWLYANGALTFAKEYFTWLSGYTTQSGTLNSFTIYKNFYLDFTTKLTSATSLSILIFCILGVFVSITLSRNYWRNNEYTLFIVGFISAILHLLLANKYISYQYGLFWWIFSPFAGLGICVFYESVFKFFRYRRLRALHILISISIIAVFVFFSPIVSIFKHLDKNVLSDMATTNDFIDFFEPKITVEDDLDTLQTKVLPLLKQEDNLFLFGHHVGVYYRFNKLPTTMILTSAFLTASWTPDSWKQAVVSGLHNSKPKYILVEMDDAIPLTNQSTLSSREHFNNWKEIVNFTDSNYIAIDSTSKFIIYQKTH